MPRKAKPNRTDLALPKVAVPGQEYGKQAAQVQAQKIVPMAPTPTAPVPSPTTPSAPAAPQVPPPTPGSLPWLHPTNRPNEPITHGLDVGPGAGSEALGPMGNVASTLSGRLADMARGPFASPQIADLAAFAQKLGY